MNYFDEYDLDDQDPDDRIVECNRCGKWGLRWEETDDGWTLVNRKGWVHVCKEKRLHRAVMDDFEDLT